MKYRFDGNGIASLGSGRDGGARMQIRAWRISELLQLD
jgi:hypothetical protein